MRKRRIYIAAVAVGAGVLLSAGNMNHREMTVHASETSVQAENMERSAEDGQVISTGQAGKTAQYTLYENGKMYVVGSGRAEGAYIDIADRGKTKEIIFQKGITKIEGFGGYEIDENGEIVYYWANLKKVVFPEGITEIGTIDESSFERVFDSCPNLEEVIFPEGLKTIGGYAFQNCWKLNHITLPESLEAIGTYAFEACHLKEIHIPENVHTIEQGAFFGNDFKEVVIPDGITEIGTVVFASCTNLEKVTIPDSVTSIGYRAFAWDEKLQEITIPESVTSLGFETFVSCGLKEIILPSNLKDIGVSGTFADNRELEKVVLNGDAPEWKSLSEGIEMYGGGDVIGDCGPFDYCSENLKIYVPKNAKGYDVEPWTKYEIVYGEEYATGDINQDGKINMKDARTALKAAVGSEALSGEQKKLGDVDADGKVGMKDARLILKYAVGSIEEF